MHMQFSPAEHHFNGAAVASFGFDEGQSRIMVKQELDVMAIICKGIDPRDGTFFDTPRDPILDKARLNYLSALKKAARRSGISQTISTEEVKEQPNQGQPWVGADDNSLKEMWATGSSASVAGRVLGRGEGAIFARLVFLGIFETRSDARRANESRR